MSTVAEHGRPAPAPAPVAPTGARHAAAAPPRPRRATRTTPATLRLAAVLLVAIGVAMLLVGLGATIARRSASHEVGLAAAPALLHAQDLYVALADADAAATRSLLAAGTQGPELRRRYQRDLATASDALAALARDSSAGTARDVGAITTLLPRYSGQVEAARANDRQGFPVGGAYLRQASALMQERILPATTTIYERELRRLDAAYDRGTSTTAVTAYAVLASGMLGGLVALQVFLRRRTNRLLNPALVISTLAVALLLVWTIAQVATTDRALHAARTEGSGPVEELATARILALRAQSASTLALVERGNGDQYLADFDAVVAQLGGAEGHAGVLGATANSPAARSLPGATDATVAEYRFFLEGHREVQRLLTSGDYAAAVTQSLGAQSTAAHGLDVQLAKRVDEARNVFGTKAADGRAGYDALVAGLAMLSLVGVGLVLVGVYPRLREYR